MRRILTLLILAAAAPWLRAGEGAHLVYPEYEEPRVVYDFFLDHPQKIGAALYWLRALINPLSEPPYSFAPEMMAIKVVLHGTEIATVAKKNYASYKDAVERMRYYAALGVEFKVCALAAEEYGYKVEDLQEFIEVVPSAFTELVHWQMQGYALITPQVIERRESLEAIR